MYLKVSEARDLAALYKREKGSTYRTTDAVLMEKSLNFSERQSYDIFLSHSFADADVILGVAKYLEDQGKSVYVDWIVDKSLDRSNVNATTAALLRVRMRASKSLVYASSESATNSKWMPWELGYFDGFKPDGVSILPVVQHYDSEWKGQEYLGLYPVIDRLELGGRKMPFLVKPDKSAMRLSDLGGTPRFIWRDSYGRAL